MANGAAVRVIDLYAGVGGWAVGFKLAGFEIAKSYEWWQPAANTHRANSSSEVTVADIRALDLISLPQDIDIVIGSPPCTQFSYSNRGGSGDVADGLIDLERFLAAVEYLKPKAWAFENVPRVKRVLEHELLPGGSLEKYAHLFDDATIEVFDMAEFGVPQRRKRCIAGNFDFELLKSYSTISAKPTLGDVVDGLAEGRDPLYMESVQQDILDNEPEEPLNWEEERFNRDMKVAHPVYNGMPFPDPLDCSSRTVTATCTRVSRESLVILDPSHNRYRRLSVRERASLQSFPVSFQFLGKSHSEKLKMIGNAIPPAFTYLIGEAIKGTPKDQLPLPATINAATVLTEASGIKTKPDNSGRTYPASRRFRFSIPNLRFKSGTRFELSNVDGPDAWGVGFYFGDSKRIHRRDFTVETIETATTHSTAELRSLIASTYLELETDTNLEGLDSLQDVWSHRGKGLHPFDLIDNLGDIVERTLASGSWQEVDSVALREFVLNLLFPTPKSERIAEQKIARFLVEIAIGAIVAAFLNRKILEIREQRPEPEKSFEKIERHA